MRYLVTGQEMKLLDNRTSDCFHVPGMVLMEQAADAFVRELLSCRKNFKSILVLCGTGNNGGDGIAIARLLNQRGYRTFIRIINPPRQNGHVSQGTDSFQLQKSIYEAYGYPQLNTDSHADPDSYDDFDLIVDALFGTGLSRDITGEYADVIRRANQSTCLRAAVDIASGISADNGHILGTAFKADLTITFSFGKRGQYLWPGSEYCGQVHVVPMGITAESFMGDRPTMCLLEKTDLKAMLPHRRAHSNKGSYGRLLVIAGSRNMAGAAIFSASAASRCGTGLVKIFTPESNRMILQTKVPEAILSVYEDLKDSAGESSGEPACNRYAPLISQLSDALCWADAVVIGPGLGTSDTAAALLRTALIECHVPLLLDADALNLIGASADLQQLLKVRETDTIITPHLGEMSRLTGISIPELQKSLPENAEAFAKAFGLTVVLKDFHTIICSPEGPAYLNLTGNNGMAAGGSGDVLTGVIGALLAAGMKAEEAAPAGVWIHGTSGDLILPRTGYHSMSAMHLLEGLQLFWSEWDSI